MSCKVAAEEVLEAMVTKWADDAGVINMKFTPDGQRGWPDRIFMKHGRVAFIEFKAVGDIPRKLQELRIAQLKDEGIPALWTDNYRDAIKFLQETLYGKV